MRLFLIGVAMGIADLIPGVSGGTIAFICGIYEPLLESIKTLQFYSLKKIAWPFLLPLGLGILSSVFFISRLFYYWMLHFPNPLFAFFFGMVIASSFFCSRKAALHQGKHWIALLIGAGIAFFITGMGESHLFGLSFVGLTLAGAIAACAMLLPGISGSYLLQLFGIYPLMLASLNAPTAPGSFKLLFSIALGAALGLILFSRVASWLITYLTTWTYAVLVGFMLGGVRAIWPFHKEGWILALLFGLIGFFLVIFLEVRMKSKGALRRI